MSTTLEEIEARWKAATPGPWRGSTDPIPRIDDARNNPVYWCDSYESYPICADDLHAIAAAPTDIAWLIAECREATRAMDSYMYETEKELGAMKRELEKHKRAHAWFATNTDTKDCRRDCDHCNHCGEGMWPQHAVDCEWVKAAELRL